MTPTAPRPGQPDPAWLDTQYNNRARVPEAPAILQDWAARSSAARRQLRCTLDLAYGAGADDRLDLFHPTAAQRGPAPVLFFVHGGYWRALDKRDHSFVATPFAEAGALVVVPDYTLCPRVRIDDIALQMVQALVWTHDHAAAYGGDPRRIVAVGHSAGGHLTAMLLACRWQRVRRDLPAQLVRSGLSLSGLFDLEPLRHTPFLAGDLQLTAASARRLSPALFPAPRAAELVALVGGDESGEFLRQNALIGQAWGAATVPVCKAVPGRHHFSIVEDLVTGGTVAHGQALRLLGLPNVRAAGT